MTTQHQQWEYLIISIGFFKDHQKKLNELGAEGWELVVAPTYTESEYIFKRPKQ